MSVTTAMKTYDNAANQPPVTVDTDLPHLYDDGVSRETV